MEYQDPGARQHRLGPNDSVGSPHPRVTIPSSSFHGAKTLRKQNPSDFDEGRIGFEHGESGSMKGMIDLEQFSMDSLNPDNETNQHEGCFDQERLAGLPL